MSYSEDIFPTAAHWETQGFDSYKAWPVDPAPASYEFVHNRPALANYSHNGRKFTRRSSFNLSQLTLTYPPMKADEFIGFHAIALAAQGQYNPFSVRYDANKVGSDINIASTAYAGDYEFHLDGMPANQTAYFKKGQIIQSQGMRNGYTNVIVADADTNGLGEATIRLAYPLEYQVNAGNTITLDTAWTTCTLANNGFEYETDEAGFYFVSVTFDLDEWK